MQETNWATFHTTIQQYNTIREAHKRRYFEECYRPNTGPRDFFQNIFFVQKKKKSQAKLCRFDLFLTDIIGFRFKGIFWIQTKPVYPLCQPHNVSLYFLKATVRSLPLNSKKPDSKRLRKTFLSLPCLSVGRQRLVSCLRVPDNSP